MNKPEQSQAIDQVEFPPADYVEVALEASCAALMALDLVRRSAPDDERMIGRISIAIAALRHAIAELRERREAGDGGAPRGFVCAGQFDDEASGGEILRPGRFGALP